MLLSRWMQCEGFVTITLQGVQPLMTSLPVQPTAYLFRILEPDAFPPTCSSMTRYLLAALSSPLLTWKALLAKPRPSCLHTTMASMVPQLSLHTAPQVREPFLSASTSTRPSNGFRPPLSRSYRGRGERRWGGEESQYWSLSRTVDGSPLEDS